MKRIILVSSAFFGLVLSRPQVNYRDAYITRYDYDNSGLGSYSFRVETSDGFKHDQTGELRNIGTDHEALVVTGSYSYIDSDGQTYTVSYIADENGFRPLASRRPSSVGVRPLPSPVPPSLRLQPVGAPEGKEEIGGPLQATLVGGGLG